MTKDENIRLQALVASLSTRLRPVCAQWPAEMFEDMVRQLAEITLRYESDSTASTYDRRGTDRLVAEMKSLLERSQRSRADQPTEDDRSERS